MRIRTIKPEFWRSDDITALSREHRLLFVGLWSYVDDNGVGIDDYRQIAADLFALEEDQKEVRDFVREALATLSRALLVARYMIDGRAYIYITGWKQHQRVDRPNKVRYPEPPPDYTPPTSGNAEPSRDPRETFATVSPPGTEEQRNRGTEEQHTRSPDAANGAPPKRPTPQPRAPRAETDPDGFADFWSAYPRKIAKRAAVKAYAAAVKRGVEPAELLTAARRYAGATRGSEARFIAHPSTWLNQGRHEDEPEPAAPHAPAQPSTTDARVAAGLALAAQYADLDDQTKTQAPRSITGGTR